MTAAQPALLGVGSLCTGSASDRIILQAVSDALAEEGVAVRFVSSFSCEKDPKKQQWIQQVHSAADGTQCDLCTFTDLADLLRLHN